MIITIWFYANHPYPLTKYKKLTLKWSIYRATFQWALASKAKFKGIINSYRMGWDMGATTCHMMGIAGLTLTQA